MLYPYTSKNRLLEPNTYFYSEYSGMALIVAWRSNRSEALKLISQTNFREPELEVDESDSQELSEKTSTTLITMINELERNSFSKHTSRQLRLLLKSFEVKKRIYTQYAVDYRGPTSSNYSDCSLYLSVAELFLLAYQKGEGIQFLNGLLKIIDSLISVINLLNTRQVERLIVLIKREEIVVGEFLNKIEV